VLGVTNREPYYTVWDTTTVADGPHEVSVRAVGEEKVSVSVTVQVRNAASAAAPSSTEPGNIATGEIGATGERDASPVESARYRGLAQRLLLLGVHHLPPPAIDERLADACAITAPARAAALLEQVLAAGPPRADVARKLTVLYRRLGVAREADGLPEPHEGYAGAKRVCLSFDDGPRPGFTEPILDLLAAHHAKATFFVVGMMAAKYPDLLRAIHAAGHEIGSHTYNHPRLDTIPEAEQIHEMVRTRVLLDSLIGPTPRLMRPPGGHYNPQIRAMLASLGYVPVFWCINCGSYAHNEPDKAAADIVGRVHDGAILLLHNGNDNTLPLLPYLLDGLDRAGYRLVTVSDILQPVNGTHPAPAPTQVESYAGTE
jgi:peptidoglycan/xylan/chitin deacetylase (PgdA/CDA1 family)